MHAPTWFFVVYSKDQLWYVKTLYISKLGWKLCQRFLRVYGQCILNDWLVYVSQKSKKYLFERHPVQPFSISVQLENLFIGVDPSNCPLPCSTFSAEIKLLSILETPKSKMILDFLPTIEVIASSLSPNLFWTDLCLCVLRWLRPKWWLPPSAALCQT